MILLYPLVALASALGIGMVASEMTKESEPVRLRTLAKSNPGSPTQWEAVELLSLPALVMVGELLDLSLVPYEEQCRTGLYSLFLVTDQTDGTGRAIAVLARKSGTTWVVDQAFGKSSTSAPDDLVRIAQQVCAALSSSPASLQVPDVEVPREARQIETREIEADFEEVHPSEALQGDEVRIQEELQFPDEPGEVTIEEGSSFSAPVDGDDLLDEADGLEALNAEGAGFQ